jgi:hypothetical protein
MRRKLTVSVAVVVSLAMLAGFRLAAASDDQAQLLKVRETVWRAWFANDRKTLEELVPEGSIAINSGSKDWDHQAEILQSAADFQSSGGKLVRLEFPRTEVQWFGDVAITYSEYLYETDVKGQVSQHSGRATEIFVRRNGKWTNPGWHTDSFK